MLSPLSSLKKKKKTQQKNIIKGEEGEEGKGGEDKTTSLFLLCSIHNCFEKACHLTAYPSPALHTLP